MATDNKTRIAVRNAAVKFLSRDTPETHRAIVDLVLSLGDPDVAEDKTEERDRMERGGYTRDTRPKAETEEA